MNDGKKYWAFISYSHRDRAFVDWLHHRIETYAVPKSLIGGEHHAGLIPARLHPVFKDRDDLAPGSSLSALLTASLESSRYLIVACSPASARSSYVDAEIRAFLRSSSVDRILAIIVSGEPGISDGQEPAENECFPLPLRYEVVDGEVSTTPREIIAADARESGDGRNRALLKVISGMLEVDFDDLVQREKRRQRKRLQRTVALLTVSFLVASALWVGMADAGITIPGGDSIRTAIDYSAASVLRPIRPESDAIDAARSMREQLCPPLVRSKSDTLFYNSYDSKSDVDIWTTAQAFAALNASPELDGEDAAGLLAVADGMFTEETLCRWEGQTGWTHGDKPPQAEIACWFVTGLAAALRSPAYNEAMQTRLRDHTNAAAQFLHQHATPAGGWAMYVPPSNAVDLSTLDDLGLKEKLRRQNANFYTSSLALQAMIEMHLAEIPFRGDDSYHLEEMRATFDWLIAGFDSTAEQPGWKRYPDDVDDAIYDGLSLQVFAVLLRAEPITGRRIPNQVFEPMTQRLIECSQRDSDFPTMSAEFWAVSAKGGETIDVSEGIGFLWYPWAVQASSQWLIRDRRIPASRLSRNRVQRTLTHLLIELRDPIVSRRLEGRLFKTSECLYALALVEQLRSDRE